MLRLKLGCVCCWILLLVTFKATPFVQALSYTRRQALLVTCSGGSTFLPFLVAHATTDTEEPFQLRIVVTVPHNGMEDRIGPDTALYVTARPTLSEGIPSEALVGGRIPPVLTTRVSDPVITSDETVVVLTQQDVTPEGTQWNTWQDRPLTISARLDTDGIASTRNSTDLVGRVFTDGKAQTTVTLPLQGRGLAGKLLTAR